MDFYFGEIGLQFIRDVHDFVDDRGGPSIFVQIIGSDLQKNSLGTKRRHGINSCKQLVGGVAGDSTVINDFSGEKFADGKKVGQTITKKDRLASDGRVVDGMKEVDAIGAVGVYDQQKDDGNGNADGQNANENDFEWAHMCAPLYLKYTGLGSNLTKY